MKKFKSYNFWVRLVSVLILLARIVLSKFGIELDSALVIDIATVVAGLLVVLGVIQEPTVGYTLEYSSDVKNNIKGDLIMTQQFKTDLTNELTKLNDALTNNDKSLMKTIVAEIDSMLASDSVAEETDQVVAEETEHVVVQETAQDVAQDTIIIGEVVDTIKENTQLTQIENNISNNSDSLETINLQQTKTEDNEEAIEICDEAKELVKQKIKDYVYQNIEQIIESVVI